MMRLGSGDFFLQLVDQALQGLQGHIPKFLVAAGFLRFGSAERLQRAEFAAGVGQFRVVKRSHGITSIIPFWTPKRSVAKKSFTNSSKPFWSTSAMLRKGRPL